MPLHYNPKDNPIILTPNTLAQCKSLPKYQKRAPDAIESAPKLMTLSKKLKTSPNKRGICPE
jgi:hypothetical protein